MELSVPVWTGYKDEKTSPEEVRTIRPGRDGICSHGATEANHENYPSR